MPNFLFGGGGIGQPVTNFINTMESIQNNASQRALQAEQAKMLQQKMLADERASRRIHKDLVLGRMGEAWRPLAEEYFNMVAGPDGTITQKELDELPVNLNKFIDADVNRKLYAISTGKASIQKEYAKLHKDMQKISMSGSPDPSASQLSPEVRMLMQRKEELEDKFKALVDEEDALKGSDVKTFGGHATIMQDGKRVVVQPVISGGKVNQMELGEAPPPTDQSAALQEESLKWAKLQAASGKIPNTEEAIGKAANEKYFQTYLATPFIPIGEGRPGTMIGSTGKGETAGLSERKIPGGELPGPKTQQRLPEQALKAFGKFKTVQQDIQQAREKFNSSWVGPVSGRAKEIAQAIQNDPKFEGLRRTIGRMITVAYGLSGQQISDKEMERLHSVLIPTIKQMDENLLATLDELEDWIVRNTNNELDYAKWSDFVVKDEMYLKKSKDQWGSSGKAAAGNASKDKYLGISKKNNKPIYERPDGSRYYGEK